MRTAIPTLALLTLIGCSQDSTDPTVSAASKSVWSQARAKIAALYVTRSAAIKKAIESEGGEVWSSAGAKKAEADFEAQASAIINQLPLLTINNESPDVLEIVKIGRANEVSASGYGSFQIPITVVLKKELGPDENQRFNVTSYSADDRVLVKSTWSAPTGKAGETHKISLEVGWDYTKPTADIASVTIRQECC